jgi:hypothetical protein
MFPILQVSIGKLKSSMVNWEIGVGPLAIRIIWITFRIRGYFDAIMAFLGAKSAI